MCTATLLQGHPLTGFVHVLVNMATSLDGRVAGKRGEPLELSGPEDWERVHRLRAKADAVMVGVGTVLSDDPRLTARTDPSPPSAPLRVVVDSNLRTPATARVVDDQAPTLVLAAVPPPDRLGQAEVTRCGTGRVDLQAGLRTLAGRGVERLLVEGGPTLVASLLSAGLVDELSLYIAPRVTGEGPSLWQALSGQAHTLQLTDTQPLGTGVVLRFEVEG